MSAIKKGCRQFFVTLCEIISFICCCNFIDHNWALMCENEEPIRQQITSSNEPIDHRIESTIEPVNHRIESTDNHTKKPVDHTDFEMLSKENSANMPAQLTRHIYHIHEVNTHACSAPEIEHYSDEGIVESPRSFHSRSSLSTDSSFERI